MEIQATTIAVAGSNSASPTGGAGAGKSSGNQSAFGELMQTVGGNSATAEKKQGTDPLATLLAALAGGLNPMALQQMPTVMTADGEQTTALVTDVMLGARTLAVSVQGLPLQNGELAALLQQFGASAQLLGAMNAAPEQTPAQTLAQHPELNSDLGAALTNLINEATLHPEAMLANPKAATLMESLFAQLLQAQGDEQQAATPVQDPSKLAASWKQPMLGKLQATMTSYTLQVQQPSNASLQGQQSNSQPVQINSLSAALLATEFVTAEPSKAGDAPDGTQSLANVLAGAQTPQQSPQINTLAKMQPVVTMQADRFHNEFADLVVKRAAMLEAPGRHEFRIVLQPQGLGEIEVRIQAIGNQISMQLSADNAATKGLLDSHLASLKSQLQAQGIQYDRIEVSSSNTGNNTNPNANGSLGNGLAQERQSGQGFQGQSGNQSNRKQSRDERFTLDAADAVQVVSDLQEQESVEDASLDVTA